MAEKTSSTTGISFVAFLAGAAAGALAVLLLAPRSGAETRALIAGKAKGAKDVAARVPDAVREASEAGRRAFSEAVNG